MGPQELRTLAEQQHGLVRTDQIRGESARRRLQRATRRGEWERVTPVVYRLAGTPKSRSQEAMLAVLDAGVRAALSHDSAAAQWGLPGFGSPPWHVTILRAAPTRQAVPYRIHQPRRLLARHVVSSDGVPVTTPARTIFDLAGAPCIHPGRIERALDTAWAAGLVTLQSLDRMLEDLGRRGRPGIKLMRSLLEVRRDAFIPAASNLERRFRDLCERAGIFDLESQVELGDEDRIGRFDYLYRRKKILFEVDSDRYHTSPLDRAADARRDERIRALGLRVIRYTEHRIWYEADEVVRELMEIRNSPEPVPFNAA